LGKESYYAAFSYEITPRYNVLSLLDSSKWGK